MILGVRQEGPPQEEDWPQVGVRTKKLQNAIDSFDCHFALHTLPFHHLLVLEHQRWRAYNGSRMIRATPRIRRRVIYLLILAFCAAGGLILLHFPRQTDPVAARPPITFELQAFYDASYADANKRKQIDTVQKSYEVLETQPSGSGSSSDPQVKEITAFVTQCKLQGSRVLDVGAGSGRLQDVVADYVGLDISATAKRFFHKPFVQASATELPFRDGEFDVVWTMAVLEHVPKPETALSEMRRVLKNKGLLCLNPAWQCRPWAADGYAVRPYSDFGLEGKITKASILLRNSVLFRSLYIFPIRVLRASSWMVNRQPTAFRYGLLAPNYQYYWTSDSDAVNSMDPFEAILWFTSRGDRCLNYEGFLAQISVRTGPLIFEIHK